ncbi:hypothetical protein VSDG_01002 [Cytospora chrysosperma]|uniref:Uncharacterized protein n=1 Tax=Cytospora chrysosperma TaxID=252740 RepID=A0A423WKR1_CYTCH|nr:hypothetical protein VSDG_01002 [Valsa sordida]
MTPAEKLGPSGSVDGSGAGRHRGRPRLSAITQANPSRPHHLTLASTIHIPATAKRAMSSSANSSPTAGQDHQTAAAAASTQPPSRSTQDGVANQTPAPQPAGPAPAPEGEDAAGPAAGAAAARSAASPAAQQQQQQQGAASDGLLEGDEGAAGTLGLPAPSPDGGGGGGVQTLEVDGKPMVLDHLGPMVVHKDGTLSRIANWHEMTDIERRNTVRVLVKRNQIRLSALREGLPKEGGGEPKESS